MSDIFISYASEDRRKAQKLGVRLEEEGWSVWWDRKIPPGQSFSKVLEEALNSAKCIVVLWSKASVVSDWVQNEAAEGKAREILVPAFIEDTAPPFEFRRIQAANLIDWEQETLDNELYQFLDAIRRVLRDERSPEKPTPSKREKIEVEDIPERPVKREPSEIGSRILSWQIVSRLALFTLVVGTMLISLFKAMYPQTPVTEALTTIIIISFFAAVGLNYCWIRWRQIRAKK